MKYKGDDPIMQAVCNFLREHDAWCLSNERAFIDTAYSAAIEAVIAYADNPKPTGIADLDDAIHKLAREWRQFVEERQSRVRQDPQNRFWQAREALSKAFVNRDAEDIPLPPLPPISEMVKQGVSYALIAKKYGFKDAHGNLLPHLVQQELDTPGSILKTPGAVAGRDWVDPRLARRARHQGEVPSNTSDAHDDDATAAPAPPVPVRTRSRPPRTCDKTPRELYTEGVSAQQAAKKLRMPLDEVEQLYVGFVEADQLATLHRAPSE